LHVCGEIELAIVNLGMHAQRRIWEIGVGRTCECNIAMIVNDKLGRHSLAPATWRVQLVHLFRRPRCTVVRHVHVSLDARLRCLFVLPQITSQVYERVKSKWIVILPGGGKQREGEVCTILLKNIPLFALSQHELIMYTCHAR